MKSKSTTKKKEVRKYKGGGFVVEEHPEPGLVVFSMNGKGFAEEFGKPFIKYLEEKQKSLLPNKKGK